jgi:hypothetical protein
MTGVSWRRALVALATVALALGGTIVAVRGDGFSAINASVPRATRWFVNQAREVVLADGFSGRTLARLNTGDDDGRLQIVQTASGAALLNRGAGTARSIDTASLRLGPATPIELVGRPDAIVGVGQQGLVAVGPEDQLGVLLPPDGEAVTFDTPDVGSAQNTRVAPDGAVWTLADGALRRITTTGDEVVERSLGRATFTLVGNRALLVDLDRARVRLTDGEWIDLPDAAAASELVLQEPGPAADCGWIAEGDDLWCVASGAVEATSSIAGLRMRSVDRFAIAGDAGAVVRADTSQLQRIDWRAGTLIDAGDGQPIPDVPPAADVTISVSVDLVWVDDEDGPRAWAVHPWGFNVIDKNDARAPVIGDEGAVVEGGEGGPADELGDDGVSEEGDRVPDTPGVDDPPIAVDDSVSARFGTGIRIVVTANDYDPDGGAVAVVDVGDASRGDVSISSATTVLYSPAPDSIGVDTFTYEITDSGGFKAEATVTVELLPADAPNRAPVGRPDAIEVRAGSSVLIDVLANDVDPERDALQIASFTEPSLAGGGAAQGGGPERARRPRVPTPARRGRHHLVHLPADRRARCRR